MPNSDSFIYLFINSSWVAGGAVSRVDPESTGLNPSWRKAIAQVSIDESWQEGADSATIPTAREHLKRGTDVLDKLTKDSGSYLNEVRTICIILAKSPRILKRWTTSGFTLRTRLQEIVLWISLPQVEKDQRDIRSLLFIRGCLWSWLRRVGCRIALSQLTN